MQIIDDSYLDLLKPALDPKQKIACCSKGNTIVAAGAGSGKTQVLATRFSYLVLSCGIQAPRILTLTFTKKAATEMKERIYNKLLFFSKESNYDDHVVNIDKDTKAILISRAKLALKDFNLTHIQTLDSYCGSVLRQVARLYGITSDFSTGDAESYRQIKNAALDFIIKDISEHKDNLQDSILPFIATGGIENFAQTLSSVVENYTSLVTDSNYFEQKLNKQVSAVADGIRVATDSLQHLICDIQNALDEDFSKSKTTVKFQEVFNTVDFGELPLKYNVNDICNNSKDCALTLHKVLKKMDEIGSASSPSDLKIFLKHFRGKNSESNEITTRTIIGSLVDFLESYLPNLHLVRLLDRFVQYINDKKRHSGKLTFTDVSKMAMKVLIQQKQIRMQEILAFDKIMIDEFQDNNGENRDLLFLLSLEDPNADLSEDCLNDNKKLGESLVKLLAKNKLFFVGDEKQSIYKFRNADVRVFNELKQVLKTKGDINSVQNMTYNYRSTAELVSSFNILFGGIMDINSPVKKSVFLPYDTDCRKPYEVYYPIETMARKVDENYNELPPVVLNKNNVAAHFAILRCGDDFSEKLNKNLYLDSDNQLAYYICSTIKKYMKKDSSLHYSDFAILDRSRRKRSIYIYWLKRFDIPYIQDQQCNLFEDAPVNDIYTFLKLCCYNNDKEAFLAFLTSSFVGLHTETAIAILTLIIQEDKDTHRDFVPFDKYHDSSLQAILLSQDYDRYKQAASFFFEKKQHILCKDIVEVLNYLWYDCGLYYETMICPKTLPFSQHYDMLFELARLADKDGKDITWFVDQLYKIKQEQISFFNNDSPDVDYKNVNFPVENSSDSINIMTIHASKGLQFPYVFVLGCFDGTEGEAMRTPYYFSDEYGPCFKTQSCKNPSYFSLCDKELNANMEFAESRRILYVACTRAQKQFFIVHAIKLKSKNAGIYADNKPSLLRDVFLEALEYTYKKAFYSNEELTDELYLPFYKDGNAFDIKFIKPVYSFAYESKGDTSYFVQKTILITALESSYKNSTYKLLPAVSKAAIDLYPSSLSSTFATKNMTSVIPKDLPVFTNRLDMILQETQGFTEADFGTLLHKNMECLIHNNDFDLEAQELLILQKTSIQTKLITLCNDIREIFCSTNIFNEIKEAKIRNDFVRTEWDFKLSLSGRVFSGQIDLIYKNANGSYIIVDYKTDRVIMPEVHEMQLAIYKKAASFILGVSLKDIQCFLCYVMHDCAFVQVDATLTQAHLESISSL